MNLVLIVLDTLRPDGLGCYGYARDTSPNLDRWAAKSVLFENAQSAAPWTAPSLASLLTSLYPSAHGVTSYNEPGRLCERATTLAELLAAQGYATAAFTEGGYAGPTFGFDQGFASYPLDERHRPGAHADATVKLGRLSDNVERAAQWLDHTGSKPFFLMFHTYETHTPYLAPAPMVRQFRPAWDEAEEHRRLDGVRRRWRELHEIDAAGLELLVAHREHCAPANDLDLTGLDAKLGELGVAALDPKRLALWRDLYDAEVRYADAQLNVLLERLESARWRDNTVVMFVSDHGEAFGEHGKFGHGSELHEECLHVLFMVHAPGVAPRRVPDVVRTVDVMPTALELLALDATVPMQGRSLAPLMAGRAARAEPSFSHSLALAGRESRLWSVRESHWRLVWDDELRRARLFDLRQDPGELLDVAAQRPQVVTRMMGLMRAQCAMDALFQARAAGPVQPVGGTEGSPSPELEQLGYGGGGSASPPNVRSLTRPCFCGS